MGHGMGHILITDESNLGLIWVKEVAHMLRDKLQIGQRLITNELHVALQTSHT